MKNGETSLSDIYLFTFDIIRNNMNMILILFGTISINLNIIPKSIDFILFI